MDEIKISHPSQNLIHDLHYKISVHSISFQYTILLFSHPRPQNSGLYAYRQTTATFLFRDPPRFFPCLAFSNTHFPQQLEVHFYCTAAKSYRKYYIEWHQRSVRLYCALFSREGWYMGKFSWEVREDRRPGR